MNRLIETVLLSTHNIYFAFLVLKLEKVICYTLIMAWADGIGTGWSTKIPNFNVREIVANLKRLLEGLDPEPMVRQWVKNWEKKIWMWNCKYFLTHQF